MGAFCSKQNPSGQQPHCCNHSSSSNAAPKGNNRFAKFGDDYHTLEQVRLIRSLLMHASVLACETAHLLPGTQCYVWALLFTSE